MSYKLQERKIFSLFERIFILSPLICMSLFIFNVEGTKFIMSRLLIIVSLYCFFKFRGHNNINYKPFRVLLYGFSPVLIYFISLHLLYDENISFSRTLFPSLIYLAVVPVAIFTVNNILIIISLGGFFSGFSSIYEVLVLGEARAGSIVINAIPYATYCAFSLVAIVSAIIFTKKDKLLLTVYTLGGIGATVGLILSQSRGIWLASFFSFIIIFLFALKKNKGLVSLKSIVIVILSISTIGYIFKDTLTSRYNATYFQVINTVAGDKENSISLRLQLWDMGIKHLSNNIIFGVGSERDKELVTEDLNENKVTKTIAYFAINAHYHNQYIDTLVRTGIIGLSLLIIYIFYPVVIVYRIGNLNTKVTICGVAAIVSIAGVTDIPFHHTHLVYFYSLLVGALILSTYNSNSSD